MTTHTEATSTYSKLALAAIALLAALAAAVFSAGHDPASAGGAACDPARTHDAGDFSETIDSGGLTREYTLHVPPSYTGAEAVPLVLNWHGLGSNAEQQADLSGLSAKADAEGFIVVMPQGLGETLHHNFTRTATEADDVAFTGDMLDELEAELCIDSARIFSTGKSNGAQMSTRLACNLSERIAAVAPVSGAYYPPFTPDFPGEPGCVSTRPAALIAFHGTADTVFPFAGGPGLLGVIFRSFEDEIMPDWAAHNGCTVGPMHEPVTANVRLVRYEGCDENATVELYVVEGGGHTWPGSTFEVSPEVEDVLGVTTHEISANDFMWDFFVAHPMPADTEPAPTPTTSPQPTATVAEVAAPTSGDGSGSGDNAGWAVGVIAVLAGFIALGAAAVYVGRRLRS